jgi:hypothetical protein
MKTIPEEPARTALKAIRLLWQFRRLLQAEDVEAQAAIAYLSDLAKRSGEETISHAATIIQAALAHLQGVNFSEKKCAEIVSMIEAEIRTPGKSKFKLETVSKMDLPNEVRESAADWDWER